MFREVLIDSVRVSLMNYQRVVILKDKESDRYLPIWIGPAEADAIAVKLQDVPVPRPLTHDLLSSVIGELGGKIDSIVVTDLSNDTFYAKLVLAVNGSYQEVDCRPSDALAVAVRINAPIFVDDHVMEKAAIAMEKDSDPEESGETGTVGHFHPKQPSQKVSGEELKRLSAFEEFIRDLKGLEELGSGSSNP